MIETIVKLVMCHLVGDFLFQSAYIAESKGKNWYHLFVHCMLYAVPFYLCFGWCWQLAVIAILHFPIDAAKARYNSISYTVDQALHYALCGLFMID